MSCRAAGNRTQSTRTRSVRTTGILQPEFDFREAVAGITRQKISSPRILAENIGLEKLKLRVLGGHE